MHSSHGSEPPKHIAVIGTGISGLSAAWLLSKRHHVTVFEKNERLGGHTNTVDVEADTASLAVDTGFIVYNDVSYPNLVALFDHLDVATRPTDMSLSVSMDGGAFEYAGSDINGLLAQRRNIARPRFWRMLRDIRRFYREAPRLLEADTPDMSLGSFLAAGGYSKSFIADHLIPMGAAIWSTPPDKMLDYPARTFVRFCENHGLLRLGSRPQWSTVSGGARQYVHKLVAGMSGPVRLGVNIAGIERRADTVRIRHASGEAEIFDDVVLATHADEALRLLGDASARERALLGPFAYQANRAVLHSDTSLMPKRKAAWTSWNYQGGGTGQLSLTYWMNRLQHIDAAHPLFVTLNPQIEPDARNIHGTFDYLHPIFDSATDAAQRDLWSLQGQRNTWFCGAYFGWGFHEDGLQSGLAVAEDLGGMRRPWTVENESYRIHRRAGNAGRAKAAA